MSLTAQCQDLETEARRLKAIKDAETQKRLEQEREEFSIWKAKKLADEAEAERQRLAALPPDFSGKEAPCPSPCPLSPAVGGRWWWIHLARALRSRTTI